MMVWLSGCSKSGPESLLEGERLLNAGKPEAAVVELKKAVTLLDKTPQAWNHLGLANHRLGRVKDAAGAYRQALTLDPNLAVTHFNYGCLLLENGNPAAAAVELASFTVHQPNSVEGWLKRGSAELRSKQLDAAEQSLRRAATLSPRSAETINALGVLQVQRRRGGEAFQSFSTAAQLQPGYAPALLNMAVLLHTGFPVKPVDYRPSALQKYREFLAIQPHPPQWDAAALVAQQLDSELNPRPPVALPQTNLLIAAIVKPVLTNPPPRVTLTNPPRVETTASGTRVPTFTATNPVPPPPLVKTDITITAFPPPAATGRAPDTSSPVPAPVAKLTPSPTPVVTSPPPAIEVRVVPPPVAEIVGPLSANRYQYRNPSRPASGNRGRAESFYATGQEFQERGRWREALEAYDKAAQADPAMFEAHHNVGLMAVQVGDTPRALTAYEAALVLQPAALSARFNFALALVKGSYHRDAANELERLLGDYPDEPRAHLALANLYAQQLFQAPQARLHYLRVLQLEPQHPQGTAIRYWLRDHPEK